MAFEGQTIYYTDQSLLPDNSQVTTDDSSILKRFQHFLREWEINKQYVYREKAYILFYRKCRPKKQLINNKVGLAKKNIE